MSLGDSYSSDNGSHLSSTFPPRTVIGSIGGVVMSVTPVVPLMSLGRNAQLTSICQQLISMSFTDLVSHFYLAHSFQRSSPYPLRKFLVNTSCPSLKFWLRALLLWYFCCSCCLALTCSFTDGDNKSYSCRCMSPARTVLASFCGIVPSSSFPLCNACLKVCTKRSASQVVNTIGLHALRKLSP